jgi:hypothetical protein
MEVDEQLPRECDGLSEVKIRAAKVISSKTGKSLSNACLHVNEPTKTGLSFFKKRGREEGGRKTRRARKNKKRQQKKSRRNYK